MTTKGICKDCGKDAVTDFSIRCSECMTKERQRIQSVCKAKYRYKQQPKAKYSMYKRGAERRGLSFEFTMETFTALWQKPCTYCGDEIDTIGLDRRKNKEGYTLENTVPCCPVCNFMKHTMDEEKFITKCKQIARL